MTTAPAAIPYRDSLEHMQHELQRLDRLIWLRALSLPLQNQEAPETQTARAVYIAPEEVRWLLANAAAPIPGSAAQESRAAQEARAELARLSNEIEARLERSAQAGVFLALEQLGRLFGLTAFELHVVVICLAPELRRKYDRLYAYLQDDITRKRPSVDLALELLCETEAERWQARRTFSEGAALLHAGLLQKVDDLHSPSGSSGLAQFLKLDARIGEFLLDNNQMDARLAGLAQFYRPAGDPSNAAAGPDGGQAGRLWRLIEGRLGPTETSGRKLAVYLHGPHGAGKLELALDACRRLGSLLLSLDMEALLALGAEGEGLLRLAFREGLLQQACLYLKHADALLQESARPLLRALDTAITEYGWLVFMSGETPWTLEDALTGCLFQPLALPVPDIPQRASLWQRALDERAAETPAEADQAAAGSAQAAAGSAQAAAWAKQLALQFRLTPGQIRAAVEQAETTRLMEAEPRPLSLADLSAACRMQSNHKLGELALKIEPHYSWQELVLPEDKLAHLHEICDQLRNHYRVFGEWGFGDKISHGKGLSVLFSGPSGTGKTMAAEVLANDLELDLYKVDLSGVVSKYIGETEKNLARIFSEAETSNALLFFDEADALFGKRTEVSDAHDRYANIETSYLLQKMEEYEGVVILATNLRENMDEAFIRRIRFIVEFPFPNQDSRQRIWQGHIPGAAPVSPEIDYAYLARELPVAGGNIKNIVLNAAFLAAADGGVIGMQHILQGARREYEKMGKLWEEGVSR